MAITKNPDRQYVLTAKVDFTFADFTGSDGVAVSAVDLPGGARVVGGRLGITTAFDSTTSDVMEIGDGTTVDRYLTSTSVAATGLTALTGDELAHATGQGSVQIEHTAGAADTATAGAGFLEVDYVIEGRGNESQPV